MKIMIHACPQRMWYVSEFLVPQLRDQGAAEDEITVWNDTEGWGNLESFVRSCEYLRSMWGRKASPHTWHIQDDVILAHDFVARARTLERETDGIVCGFCCLNWGPKPIKEGIVPIRFMWNGFQCLRIPDRIAAEFAVWFRGSGCRKPELQRWVGKNKGDDSIFRAFCLERHGNDTVRNINPNLADHVDFLIGGTVLNPARSCQYNRALFWDPKDAEAVVAMRDRLTQRAQTPSASADSPAAAPQVDAAHAVAADAPQPPENTARSAEAKRAVEEATRRAVEEIDAGAKKPRRKTAKKKC